MHTKEVIEKLSLGKEVLLFRGLLLTLLKLLKVAAVTNPMNPISNLCLYYM
jgi:hypothetical protein